MFAINSCSRINAPAQLIRHSVIYQRRLFSVAPNLTENSPNSSLINRFAFIDERLRTLSSNTDWIQSFAAGHYLFDLNSAPPLRSETVSIPVNSIHLTCQTVGYAIVNANILRQTRYKHISSFEELENELTDAEEGTFLLEVAGTEFINNQGTSQRFQGHAFTIIKVIEGQETGYRVAQSYVDEYSLYDFLQRDEKHYFNFATLKKEILQPLYSILQKEGPWTKQECEDYYSITSIYPEELIGFFPDAQEVPSMKLLTEASFGRTTNKTEGNAKALRKKETLDKRSASSE